MFFVHTGELNGQYSRRLLDPIASVESGNSKRLDRIAQATYEAMSELKYTAEPQIHEYIDCIKQHNDLHFSRMKNTAATSVIKSHTL